MNPVIEKITETFLQRGSESYGIEAVTQIEHALQCALLARENQSSKTLVAAALLHDLGHILGDKDLPEGFQDKDDYHDHHEEIGYQFLLENFGPPVADPVRLHVPAKRYLCTTNPSYCDILSPVSLKSYHDQGGPMSEEELARFRAKTHFEEAIQLRHWDDQAKEAGKETPSIEDFHPELQASLIQ